MPEGQSERTLAECATCGAAYAARRWDNGTIQPIGRRNGCECGSNEFRVVEAATSAGRGTELE